MTFVPPHDQEAEECLIGAMLLSPTAIEAATSTLTAADFYLPAHATIFEAARLLRETGVHVDAISVASRVEAAGAHLDSNQLVHLMAQCPTVNGVQRWAQIIVDKSVRRRILTEAIEFRERAQDVTTDVSEIIEAWQVTGSSFTAPSLGGEPEDVAVEEFLETHRDADPQAKWAVHGLIRKRHKIIIVGGESDGKSWLARQIAICAAYGIQPFRHTRERPLRTLLVDLENPPDALAESFETILRKVWMESSERETTNRLWWRPAGIDLRNRADVAQFERVLEARRPELVCLGPMYCAYDMKHGESWEAPVRQVQNTLKQLMVRYDFALILEDHAPQADSSGKRPMRPYGSSFWRRWVDIGIGMEPINEGRTEFKLEQWKKRVGTDWPKYIIRGDDVGSSWPWVPRWE